MKSCSILPTTLTAWELDLAERSFLEWNHFIRCVPEYVMWRMINSRNQLEEKMMLFWHGILCTADSKTPELRYLSGRTGYAPEERHGQFPGPAD